MKVNKIEIQQKDNNEAIIIHYGDNKACNIAWPNPIDTNGLAQILIALANKLEKID